jgi:hypothetical protein
MLATLRTGLDQLHCSIYSDLPSAVPSTVDGSGIRFFHARAANNIFVCPCLPNGACAAYVVITDVCLTVTDGNARPVRVCTQTRLDSSSGTASITYVLDTDAAPVPKELHVRVHVCGVLLVDVRVRKAFDGRTDGQLHCQHASERNVFAHCIAIHPTGAHLVISDYAGSCLNVFARASFQFVKTLGRMGAGPTELFGPRGLCFTDAGTLLITDYCNHRVQRWTLNGEWIATYPVRDPFCVTSRGDVFAVGSLFYRGVRVFSLESGAETGKWLCRSNISAIAAVSADTLVIADHTAEMLELYTLEGVLKQRLATGIISFGLAVCADDCLIAADWYQARVRVFSTTDGAELTTSAFATHTFEGFLRTIVLYAEHVYILEELIGVTRICVFE